jgi:hypothetical protein
MGVVRDLMREFERMCGANEALSGALAKLRIEHQSVMDELARLKDLPPRPPIKPSGIDEASPAEGPQKDGKKVERSTRWRGSHLDELTISATVVVKAHPPVGSRNKGFEDIVVQDVGPTPTVTLYRRERFETPEGKTIVADLDAGILGGYGPDLHRLVLVLHIRGQMTCERILALLVGLGVVISKRQGVRMLTATLEAFRAEDAAVLKAALTGAFVTVDDTGARHAGTKTATPLRSARTGFACFARVRANRVWPSFRGSPGEPRSM